jgi:hypothetical protein
MTVQTFKEMLSRRPFQPVRVTLSSGQSYEIRHPENALLTRTTLLVGVDETPDGVPAEFKILSLLHVTSMEPITPQAA